MKMESMLIRQEFARRGMTLDDFDKPLIAVFYEDGCLAPCGVSDDLRGVICGIESAGGVALPLCLPRLCDWPSDITAKSLLLPMRENTADTVETLAGLYSLDGAVLAAASEPCVSGFVMGAIRKNLPFAFLPSPIRGSFDVKKTLTALAGVSCGRAGLESAEEALQGFSGGRSLSMDTVNGLCVFFEAAEIGVMGGLALNSISGQTSLARETGRLACERAKKLSYPRRDFTIKMFNSGLSAFLAAGGPPSALIHLIAIARENGFGDVNFAYIEEAARNIPPLSSTVPFGDDGLIEFAKSGGTKTILNRLGKIKEKDLSKKGEATCGICSVKGNIANTAITRKTADKVLKLKAAAFDSEDFARGAIFSGGVSSGTAIVIKGQQAAGMPLMDIESAVVAAGLEDCVIITDGRSIELGVVPTISLIEKTPAFNVINSGDALEIDFKKMRVNLDVSSKELSSRQKRAVNEPSASGSLLRYVNLAEGPDSGCILKQKF